MADVDIAQPHSPAYGGKGPLILGLLWTELTLGTILVCLRLYVGSYIRKKIGWDFFWAAITLVLGITGSVLVTVGVSHGMGNHLELLQPRDAEMAALLTICSISVVILGYTPGKIAIIAFLLQLQGYTHPKKAMFLHFLAYSNLVASIVSSTLNMVQCTPPRKSWSPQTPGNCNNDRADVNFGYLQGAWSAATDLILAGYPIIVFWSLQMPKRLKVGLCLLMGTGIFSCACACLKTFQIHHVAQVQDRTEALTPLILWAWTEFWVVLIAGSLPPLRPLFVQAYQYVSNTVFTKSYTSRESKSKPSRRFEGVPSTQWPRARGIHHHHRLGSGLESSDPIMSRDEVIIMHDVSVSKEPANSEERLVADTGLSQRDRLPKHFEFGETDSKH